LDLARGLGERLHLVYTLGPATGHSYGAIRHALSYVEGLGRQVSNLGIGCETSVVADDPVAALLDLVDESGASLISLASPEPGRSPFWRLGTLADRLVERAPVPVLIQTPLAGDRVDHDVAPAGPIVVALDGSPIAEAVLPEAARLARGLGRGISLVYADEARAYGGVRRPRLARAVEAADGDAASRHGLAAWVRGHGIAALGRSAAGEFVHRIRDRVEREDAVMVAMTARGHAGFGQLRVSPTATAVLRAVPVPVLLLGPAALARVAAPALPEPHLVRLLATAS
jgi:nucleotide-binding universal stress UspA family protein